MRALILVLALSVLVAPERVFAQGSSQSVSVSAIRTDFVSSWGSLDSLGSGKYRVSLYLVNRGALESRNAVLSIALPSGWSYTGTEGKAGKVRTAATAYGELVEWRLSPLGENQSVEIRADLLWTEADTPEPVFVSLSSEASVPIYVELGSGSHSQQHALWSSWVRSVGARISLICSELINNARKSMRITWGHM